MKKKEFIENMANKIVDTLFEGKSAQYRSDCCDAPPKNEWYLNNKRCSECGESCEYVKLRNEGFDFDEFLDAGDAAKADIESEFGEEEFSPLGDQEDYDSFVKSIEDPSEEPSDWDEPFSIDPEDEEIKGLLRDLEEGEFKDLDFGGTIRMKEDIKPTRALVSGEELLTLAQDLETSLGNFDHDIRKTTQHTPSGTIHGYSDSGVSPRELQQLRDNLSHAIVSYLVKYDELPHLMGDIMDNINHLLKTNGFEPIVVPDRGMIPVNETKTMKKQDIEKLKKEREQILKQLKEGYYDDDGDYVGDDFEPDEWIDEPEEREFTYYINLDERGEFYADVRDPDGMTVFEIHGFQIFEDGFMKNKWDLRGLKEHLVDLGIMDKDDDLTSETPSYARRESTEKKKSLLENETQENGIKSLLGKTLSNVEVRDEEIWFIVADNGDSYKLYHRQDCCEHVFIEDINGDLGDLVGSPITQAEESSNTKHDYDEEKEKTWTFYKLATQKGYVTIRWFGESNGYYSTAVSFKKVSINESLRKERESILKELNMLEYGVNNRLEFIEKPNGLLIKLYDVEDFKDEFDGKVINAVDILEYGGYLGNGWEDATDNFSGALTSSPIIGKDLELDEKTGMWYATEGSEVYWFPNYQVEDPWKTLEKTGEVFFQKGT